MQYTSGSQKPVIYVTPDGRSLEVQMIWGQYHPAPDRVWGQHDTDKRLPGNPQTTLIMRSKPAKL